MSRGRALKFPRLHALHCHTVIWAAISDPELWAWMQSGHVVAAQIPGETYKTEFRLTKKGEAFARSYFQPGEQHERR